MGKALKKTAKKKKKGRKSLTFPKRRFQILRRGPRPSKLKRGGDGPKSPGRVTFLSFQGKRGGGKHSHPPTDESPFTSKPPENFFGRGKRKFNLKPPGTANSESLSTEKGREKENNTRARESKTPWKGTSGPPAWWLLQLLAEGKGEEKKRE